MQPESSTIVFIWWMCLIAIGVFNIALWTYAYTIFRKKRTEMDPQLLFYRKGHVIMSLIYTLGCAFRSFLPREDVIRIVMVDHWISAVAIGRSVATIAELCMILHLSFLLHEGARYTGNKAVKTLSFIPFPLIVIAEIFSWRACTTTNFINSVFEESLWAISALVVLVGVLLLRKEYVGKQLRYLYAVIASLGGYFVYMVTVDVPSYYRAWLADTAAGKTYVSVSEGFMEVATEWTTSRAYEHWEYAIIWMTLYFSLAVWASITFINAPYLNQGLKKR